MPFFHHGSDEERQRQEEVEARRVATLEALRDGEVPPAVFRRLQDAGRRTFTSTLSASDALLLRQVGVRPLTHVTGSAVFTLGQWQYPVFEGEVAELELWNQARLQALLRLGQAAQAAGADAVVDVRLSRQDLAWAHGVTREYRAIGTAVRVEGEKRRSLGLTHLSAQDFWKLYTSGWWPCGVVSARTVYRIPRGEPVQTSRSEELVDAGRGMRHAAELTVREAHRQVRLLQGQGLVGATVEHGTWEEEVAQPAPGDPSGKVEDRAYLYCRFELVGTAVVRYAARRPVRVQPVLWLNAAARPDPLQDTAQEQHDGAEAET